MPIVQNTVIQIAAALVQEDMVHQVLVAFLDQWLNLSVGKLKGKKKENISPCDYFNEGMKTGLKIPWYFHFKRGDPMLDST